ncbi:DUF6461 domain-containing protein [Micromonospora sp. NPDC023814]|uniref:DUF6461 domain-containing protein n=1 Tax=Micromonospora sp. NPDC023814 TaxID=3154596 RepID=UPI0033D5D92F
MPEMLRQFHTLSEPVTSPSGVWALRYDAGGRAVIADQNGVVTWAAGAAGVLRLELSGVFAVHADDEVVWRGDLPVSRYTAMRVSDSGDAVLYDDGLPVYSVLHGPIESASLGNRAPVAEIRGSRFIQSDNGKRTVHRTADGTSLVCTTILDPGAVSSIVVQPEEVRTLEQPDTWLTWRFLDDGEYGSWCLVLVGPNDDVRWVFGKGHVGEQGTPSAVAPAEPEYDSEWLDRGLEVGDAYCVTVIHDVDPDEALRRFGALDEETSTATWAQLQRRANYEDVDSDFMIVAAFPLGSHTLLIEDNGYEAADRPDLSRGTFAVSSYCSINNDHRFLVSRDGEVLASFTDFLASEAKGAAPAVLATALAEMGIDDIEAFDDDNDNYLDDLELLCRVAGVRPRVDDVTGRGRVAILRRVDVHRRVYGSREPMTD